MDDLCFYDSVRQSNHVFAKSDYEFVVQKINEKRL